MTHYFHQFSGLERFEQIYSAPLSIFAKLLVIRAAFEHFSQIREARFLNFILHSCEQLFPDEPLVIDGETFAGFAKFKIVIDGLIAIIGFE